ncbi:MAG: hypothetical protein M3P13_02695 [Acidobacteriota bacterium]|nr:hypothetical protein [Acidobacteriota bacterium]
MEVMMLQQTPIIVRVVQQPVESTSLSDVLVGAIGLTGALILLAVLLGGAFGGLLIGVKLLRRRLNQEPASDSDIIHIV